MDGWMDRLYARTHAPVSVPERKKLGGRGEDEDEEDKTRQHAWMKHDDRAAATRVSCKKKEKKQSKRS